MTGPDTAYTTVRARLARVCADLDDLLALVPRGAVDRVLATARELTAEPARVAAVHSALDELEEHVRRAGVAGWSTHRGPRPDALPGLGDGRAIEEVCVCPRSLCARVDDAAADPGGDPLCQVWNARMPRVRLDR
ncbi:hypothetical protein [Streptomyces sp. NPDC052701]|uniref:hypothetical protein n=1 Tax=Streptomyces sp. NPDC052701 TaxID=3155533 RepID=UPI00342BD211